MSADGIESSEDMAGGAVSPASNTLTSLLVKRERWRHRWAVGLAWLSVAIVVLFYCCLLVFIFCGHLWFSFALQNPRVFSMPHTLAEAPIILALSTIPTLILIALLRFFHVNDRKKEEDAGVQSPVLVQACRELLSALEQKN